MGLHGSCALKVYKYNIERLTLLSRALETAPKLSKVWLPLTWSGRWTNRFVLDLHLTPSQRGRSWVFSVRNTSHQSTNKSLAPSAKFVISQAKSGSLLSHVVFFEQLKWLTRNPEIRRAEFLATREARKAIFYASLDSEEKIFSQLSIFCRRREP